MQSTNLEMPGTVANCELDTHYDTCVVGPNFRVDEYTGEYCDVTPFSNAYKPTTNIPIVNTSTAYTDETTGETLILRFNQVIWYGTKLSMSLINPNQLRYFGVSVSDDPTDRNRFFGISSDGLKIQFEMNGTIVYFKSKAPTRWEMENCKIIELTLDYPWNPGDVQIMGVNAAKTTFDMEAETKQQVYTFADDRNHHVFDANFDCCAPSSLTPFDEQRMIHRMISAVHIATSHRDNKIAYIGAKDRHSQVTP